MNLNLNKLSKYSTWIILVVFVLVILTTFQGLFTDNLSSIPNAPGWSMEYNWSTYVARGIPLYPKEPTFIEGQSLAYMPLYFVIVGNLMKVFGFSSVVGKIVSALAVLGVAVLIYRVGVKLTDRKLLSIVPSLLFLLYPITSNYTSVQMKIEPLGLLFSTASLYLALNKKYLWAVLPAVLALFTKQYFIVLPIATATYLLWKDRSTLVRYVSLYLVLIGVGFGVGQYVTGGTFFTHTVLFLGTAPDFTTLIVGRSIVGMLMSLGYLAPVLIVAIYGMRRTRYFGLLGIYLVVSLVILAVTVGKVGSGINYTFDALVASCCLASLVLRRKDGYQLEADRITYPSITGTSRS